MKHLLSGAAIGVLWLLLGLPYTVPSPVLAAFAQPVSVAFVAGILARPYLTGRRWTR